MACSKADGIFHQAAVRTRTIVSAFDVLVLRSWCVPCICVDGSLCERSWMETSGLEN